MAGRSPVFEELLVLTSLRIANEGKKYAAVRFVFGALLSTFDTITDVYMILTYYATGEPGFATANLISLLTNIGLQLLFVFFQNRNSGGATGLSRFYPRPGFASFLVRGISHSWGARKDRRGICQ